MYGRQVSPNQIEFGYPAPAYVEAYHRFFRCSLHFNSKCTRMHFPGQLLTSRIVSASPAQLALAIGAMNNVARAEGEYPDIVSAVESVIRRNLRSHMTMEAVADKLMMSARTLHRRLAENGEQFRSIRDRVRLERARSLLRNPNISIAVIGAEVGFSNSREFRRAYQRWTRRCPSADRSGSTSIADQLVLEEQLSMP